MRSVPLILKKGGDHIITENIVDTFTPVGARILARVEYLLCKINLPHDDAAGIINEVQGLRFEIEELLSNLR